MSKGQQKSSFLSELRVYTQSSWSWQTSAKQNITNRAEYQTERTVQTTHTKAIPSARKRKVSLNRCRVIRLMSFDIWQITCDYLGYGYQCWMIIMSLKDQGNEYFRVGRYAEAIKCYQEYIEYDPQADKKTAYCNISFCHYKLKDYKDSIEAADDSISEDPSYNKAYYRKMQAYKQLPDSDYDVYINAVQLVKFSPNMAETEKYDYQLLIKEYKDKWLKQLEKDKVFAQEDACIFEDFSGRIEVESERRQTDGRTADEWIEQWMEISIANEQHWNKIEQIAKRDKQYGLNLAFLYLNHFPADRPEYKVIKQKIVLLQATLEGKMDIEDQPEIHNQAHEQVSFKGEEHKKSQSSDENLFQSSDHFVEGPKDNIAIPQVEAPVLQQQVPQPIIENKVQALESVILTNNQVKKAQSCQITEQQQKQKTVQLPNQKQVGLQLQNIDQLFKTYTANLESSRDLMIDLLKIVEAILSQSLSLQTKSKLLTMIKDRYHKPVHLMKKSFSKKQQQNVYQLLIKNNLQAFLPDFASKHSPQ